MRLSMTDQSGTLNSLAWVRRYNESLLIPPPCLRQIKDDGKPDVAHWNQQIATHFPNSTWFDGSWLFNECLMYRRLRELYNLSSTWQDYDPFLNQKNATFKGSFGAVFELSHKFSELVKVQSEEDSQIWFHELMQ